MKNSICITKQLLKSDLEIRKKVEVQKDGAMQNGSFFKLFYSSKGAPISKNHLPQNLQDFRPPRIDSKNLKTRFFASQLGPIPPTEGFHPQNFPMLSPTLPATRPVFRILGLHRNLRGLEIRRHHRLSGHFFVSDPPGVIKRVNVSIGNPGVLVEKKQRGTVLSIEMLVVEWGSVYS